MCSVYLCVCVCIFFATILGPLLTLTLDQMLPQLINILHIGTLTPYIEAVA